MKRFLTFAVTILLLVNKFRAADFKFGSQILTVPDGYEVELVSNTNLVQRPVSMDFDEQGRLYVTDSSGSNEPVAEQLEKKPHRILRLEDTDGDGRFDKSIVFADKMMFPEGAMWLDGSLYVGAPPSIWKLTDTNNDGVADVRVEWHQGKTLNGCANDLHGPYLGPDGWIYWCKGAFEEQTYEVNGKPFTTKASHIFRARPDHSGIEPVLTGGMDNPISVAFSPEGERFLAGTFFEPDIPGMRDGVIHAIYGGVYGKPHPDVLDPFKKTGELMPVMTHLGSSASASVISYRSKIFGNDFQNNLFVANFNLHNVTRHILEPDGATYKTKDSVFLSCEGDPDFHPTHVLEDADGSLLVIDTGGWYKICCPTSQLYKPDVLGAIYRIRKTGAKKIEDPRGLKMDWAKAKPVELTKFLDDERPYVVERAIQTLAKHGDESLDALRTAGNFWNMPNAPRPTKPPSIKKQRNIIWALTRIDNPKARQAVHAGLFNTDVSVQKVALQSKSLWRDTNNYIHLGQFFRGKSDQLRRIAAETLGRVGATNMVGILLHEAIGSRSEMDRVLEHSLIYALIEMNDPESTLRYMGNSGGPPLITRVALIALDQMDNGNLKPEQVAPYLLSGNAALKEAASWIVSHHPEWGDVLTGFFRDALGKKEISTAEKTALQKQLAELASNASIQDLIATTLQSGSSTSRLIALHSIAQSGLKSAPVAWTMEITKLLAGKELIAEAIAAARSVPPAKEKSVELSDALLKIARDQSQSAESRLNALAALPNIANLEPELFDFLRANLDSTKPVLTRTAASSVLTRGKLSQEQLLALTDSLKSVGPMEVMKLLSAFEKPAATNEIVGIKLISALDEAKTINTMRVERLKPLFEKYPASVQSQAESLYALLNVNAKKQSAHIDELLVTLKDGDIRRGQIIFNSAKAACSSCHTIGYGGGHVGPDLTKIGTVRTERDLLEAVVFPSASFVRSFEPMIVATKDGEDYSGVLKKDAPDEIILVTGPNAEVKIARADIKEMRPGTISVMPAGLDEQLSKQELADLIAFLKATRW
ncbi:MAG: PVC-type heme-binding CxxCH protein [Verrucomicrobiota bacterium]